MLKWCSFCQSFLGEKPPYENLGLTHGICAGCARKGLDLSHTDFNFSQKLLAYQTKLWTLGKIGSSHAAQDLVLEGLQLRLRPLDVLLGFISPALSRIGDLWEKGQITDAEQLRFTGFCERVLDALYAAVAKELKPIPHPVIITCVRGNVHFLGIRILEFFLLDQKIAVHTIYPGLSPSRLVQVAQRIGCRLIGVSIATTQQCRQLKWLSKALSMMPDPPEVVVGGYPVKNGLALPQLPHLSYQSDMTVFAQMVERQVKVRI